MSDDPKNDGDNAQDDMASKLLKNLEGGAVEPDN